MDLNLNEMKEKALLYFEDFKWYFVNIWIWKWKILLYFMLIIILIGWLYLNYLTYQYNTDNIKIVKNIKMLKQQNSFLKKNMTQLYVVKTLNKDKNVDLINYIASVYNFVKNYKNWKKLWTVKIKNIRVQKTTHTLIIWLENITDYAFFDNIIEHLKQYKNNVNIQDVKIKVDDSNKEYLSYIMTIKLTYSNVFNNN